MKKNHGKIHLLSLGILLLSFLIICRVLRDAGGYLNLGKFLALFALVILGCSFLMGGRLIPLITTCGYLVSFLIAHFFQRDGVDPGGGTTNNFGRLWIIAFFTCFVLSLYFESVYANKKLHKYIRNKRKYLFLDKK